MTQLPDRLPGGVELPAAKQQVASRPSNPKGDDSRSDSVSPRPARRISARQLQLLRDQLSFRDFGILFTVRDYRLMRAHQIRRIHFDEHATEDTAERIARRVLRRLVQRGLLHRLERRVGGVRAGSAGFVYSLSPLGHRLLGSSTRKRSYEPSPTFMAHTLAITELGTMVTKKAIDLQLNSWEVVPEPRCWRSYHDGSKPVTLKPDLYIRLSNYEEEWAWFVEVDLGTESRTQVLKKCKIYEDYWRTGLEQEAAGLFPKVLWSALTARRVVQLERYLESFAHLGPDLYDVCEFGATVGGTVGR